MTKRIFIEVSQRGLEGPCVWQEKCRGIFCNHCNRPRQHCSSIEITLQDSRLKPSPNASDPRWGLTFWKKSLLELIDIDDISRYLCIGIVRNNAGKPLDEWLYLYSTNRIIIRGSRGAGFRLCPECGHTLYSAQGPEYLYPAPPEDVPIFQSDKSSLVIDSRYLDRDRLPKSRSMGSQILRIAEKPKDGFDEFPYPYG
jgi:hypothetical protein